MSEDERASAVHLLGGVRLDAERRALVRGPFISGIVG